MLLIFKLRTTLNSVKRVDLKGLKGLIPVQARTEMVRWVRVNEINTSKMHLRVFFSSLKKKEKSSSKITARRQYYLQA